MSRSRREAVTAARTALQRLPPRGLQDEARRKKTAELVGRVVHSQVRARVSQQLYE